MKSRRAALELSVSTIVVIVLGVTMLIIGMVLVRNIMCGALGLTGEINSKVRGEINRLFGAQAGEIQCIGAGGEPVQLIPGKLNLIYCGINAESRASYELDATSVTAEGVAPSEMAGWIKTRRWTGDVSPGDQNPKTVVRLDLPSDAPEGLLIVKLDVKRNGQPVTSLDLDFEVKRAGLVRASVC